MRQPGRGGRCRLRPLGASPRGTIGTYQSLPVRAGLARTCVAAAELPRAAGHLFAASGYQECEDEPLLELINSVADSAVPVRPRIRPAHCTVRPTCLQPAAHVTARCSAAGWWRDVPRTRPEGSSCLHGGTVSTAKFSHGHGQTVAAAWGSTSSA